MGKTVDSLVVNGNKIKCPICSHDQFWTRKTLLNTPGLTLLGLDFANKEAQNYVCDECGYVL